MSQDVDLNLRGGVERSSNLELYRIIVMLLIIAHHYVVNSGLWEVIRESPIDGHSVFLYLFGMWGKIGINCFVLITGYFMCKSEISIRKFLKLLLQIEFYKIAIYLIFLLAGYETLSLAGCIKALAPVVEVNADFVGCFLIFYLCIPFLNILIKNLTQKLHLNLIILMVGVYSVLSMVMNVEMNYVTWFGVLYLISSYIRLYGLMPSWSCKQWGVAAAAVWGLCIMSVLSMLWIFPQRYTYTFVSDSNELLAVLAGVASFMWFKNMNIRQSRLINILGGSTFGVLLIHANSNTMRRWLWQDTLDNVGQFGVDSMYLHAVVSVLAIFILCVILDRIRIRCVETPLFRYIDKFLSKSSIIARFSV